MSVYCPQKSGEDVQKKPEYNKKYNKEHYDMNKAMKNLSIS